jgi:hypothetical protein
MGDVHTQLARFVDVKFHVSTGINNRTSFFSCEKVRTVGDLANEIMFEKHDSLLIN